MPPRPHNPPSGHGHRYRCLHSRRLLGGLRAQGCARTLSRGRGAVQIRRWALLPRDRACRHRVDRDQGFDHLARSLLPRAQPRMLATRTAPDDVGVHHCRESPEDPPPPLLPQTHSREGTQRTSELMFWSFCFIVLLFVNSCRYHYNAPNNTNYYSSTVQNQGVDPKLGTDVFSARSWGGSVAAEGLVHY